MCDYLTSCFFGCYPTQLKKHETEEGRWLRLMMRIAWVAHLGLAIMALAMVGFWCMFINIL